MDNDNQTIHYHFKINNAENGYWAECIELPGCLTQADTMEELWNNMRETLNTFIKESSDSMFLASLPKDDIFLDHSTVSVPLDPDIAKQFYQRRKQLNSNTQIPTELTVFVKDSERSYKHKFLIYEKYFLEPHDPIMQRCIQEALMSFGHTCDDISIKIKATLKVQ